MTRKSTMLIAWLFLSPLCSSAADKTILQDFTEEMSLGPTASPKIFQLRLDVTQDGKPELFVAAAGGAYGLDWGVYSPQSDGSYKKLGFVTFHYEAFHYSAPDSILSAYVRVRGNLGGYTLYHIGVDGITELPGQPDDAAEAQRAAEWKQSGRPKLYWAELADLRSGSTVVWKDFYTSEVGPDLGRLDGRVSK